MDVYAKMKELSIELPPKPKPGGIYAPMIECSGKLVYTSGNGCAKNGIYEFIGKVGKEVTLEQGQECARRSILNVLANVQSVVGDLNKVKQFVKILGFVASDPDFYDHPKVLNAASQLLIDIFGEEIGKCARSAIGVCVLPNNQPVEIEVVLELK